MSDYDSGRVEAQLDYHVARLDAESADAAGRSFETAARPDAVPQTVTFAELRVGDYMTNEGPGGRWVLVVELHGPACYVRSRQRTKCGDTQISVLFEIPEPVNWRSMETGYWIEREITDPVLIDMSAR